MIALLDEQFRRIGITSCPVRYKLHINLVKIKCLKAIDGKKVTLRIAAMDEEQSVDVLKANEMPTNKEGAGEVLYSINQDLTFEVSYGVTKMSIKGFYPGKLGKTALAFYNDLSLKRLLESD
jgi:hypothetical protein